MYSAPKKKYKICSHRHLRHEVMSAYQTDLFPAEMHQFNSRAASGSVSDIFLHTRAQRSTTIRVLIAKAEHASSAQWIFTAPHGFMVTLLDGAQSGSIIRASALTISIQHGYMFCNGKRIKQQLRIAPINGHISCNEVLYDGSFIIAQNKKLPDNNSHFFCINEVELEDYVHAVLRTESWPGWPLEVNKAFAIACRSYALFQMREARRCSRIYHVKNTNAHQTYRGKHDGAILKMAVEQTRGVVLCFKEAPILAMFDSCCGGIIPSHIEDFDFHKAPYLAREYACHFCKQSSLYAWRVSCEHSLFESLIKQHIPEITRISDIRVTRRDKAGLVKEVTIKSAKDIVTISGKRLYSIVKDIKSFHFDVHKQSHEMIFTGGGWGHHLGLCQWGARDMVRNGWDYKSILRFYYPGAYFRHLI